MNVFTSFKCTEFLIYMFAIKMAFELKVVIINLISNLQKLLLPGTRGLVQLGMGMLLKQLTFSFFNEIRLNLKIST